MRPLTMADLAAMPLHQPQPLPELIGRFVCLACCVDLHCVRIGVWRCPVCNVVGPLTFESDGFSVAHVPWRHRDVPTDLLFRHGRINEVTEGIEPERATR